MKVRESYFNVDATYINEMIALEAFKNRDAFLELPPEEQKKLL
jgi:hypothetical protein